MILGIDDVIAVKGMEKSETAGKGKGGEDYRPSGD